MNRAVVALVPVDPGLWVVGAAATETAIGAFLVAGPFKRAAAAAAFLTLTLTLFGLTTMLFVAGPGPLSLDCRRAGDRPAASPDREILDAS